MANSLTKGPGHRRGSPTPPTQLRERPVILALALMLGLAACDADRSSAAERPTGAESGRLATLQLDSCSEEHLALGQFSGRTECGRLSVAENPELPEGRRIELNIVRLPAIASSPKPDPLFILTGGPGEAATDLVDRLPPLFRKVNRERDLVFVDQRGTGQSNPLDCTPEDLFDYSLSPQDSYALQESLLRECLAAYDADLRFYTTPYAMDDIDQVKTALGYGWINLWGGSYGTRAALVYMRRHGDAVRSAVLDGVAPFAIQLPHHALVDADNALRRLVVICERQQACRERFGDLEDTTRRLITELDTQPRNIEVEHPLTQETIQVNFSGQLLASLIRLALYQRDLGPILPLAIESAAAGDFRPFVLMLTLAENISDSLSLGLQQTILCAEDILRPAPGASAEQSILQLDLLDQMQSTCAFWPRGKLPDGYFEPVYSETPILLISGELDPVTPPRWADNAAETLPNSVHVRVSGAHHIASNTGCVDDLVLAFINAGHADDLDRGCVSAVEPFPPFVTTAGPAMTAQQEATNDD